MTAPSHVALGTPNGVKLGDGHPTLIAWALTPNVAFWEKSVTPPGLDGGDAVDTTTMRNVDWRTFSPRTLITLTEFSFTAGYDPAVYTDIVTGTNVSTTFTVYFPNGDRLSFYGFLKSFEFDALEEGTFPTATVTVVPTNQDPVNCTEEAPVFSATGSQTSC